MIFSCNKPSSTAFRRMALASSSMALLVGGTFAPSALAAQAPAAGQTPTQYRSFQVQAQQTQGLPGQYQAGYSAKNDALWVTSSAWGAVTGTLAKVNPKTMKIENTVSMDVVDSIPRGGTTPTGHRLATPYGVGVDDAHNTVWVTNTLDDSITVYDQTTMKKVFTTRDLPQGEREALGMIHPREVHVARGMAFVGVRGQVIVFDAGTYKHLKTLKLADVQDRQFAVMNSYFDEKDGKAYFPLRITRQVKVVNLNNLDEAPQTLTLEGGEDSSATFMPSDIAVDHSLNEMYVTSQGKDGKNSGVGVYDLSTGALKKWIELGGTTLAVDNDEEHDLVYVTNFDRAKNSRDRGLYVLDGKTQNIAAVVSQNPMGTAFGVNDVVATPYGAITLDKSEAYLAGEVPFTIDYTTGQNRPSATEISGVTNTAAKGEDPVWKLKDATPIKADTITKVEVTENGMVPGHAETAQVEATEVKTIATRQDANATVTGATVLPQGQGIKFTGEGWKVEDGSAGSTVVAKYDKNRVSVNGSTEIATIQADANGKWEATLPFPTAENSNAAAGTWDPGTKHTISFLSGSSKDGDKSRGVNVEVTIAAGGKTEVTAPEAQAVRPMEVAFQGYGTYVDSTKGLEMKSETRPDDKATPEVKPDEKAKPEEKADAKNDAKPEKDSTAAPEVKNETTPTSDEQKISAPAGDRKDSAESAPAADAPRMDGGQGGPGAASNGNSSAQPQAQAPAVNSTRAKSDAPSGQLAYTGAGGIGWMIGAGAIALAAGATLVVLRRRRTA